MSRQQRRHHTLLLARLQHTAMGFSTTIASAVAASALLLVLFAGVPGAHATCPAGQYNSSTTCANCAAGTFTNATNDLTACYNCSTGTWSPTGGQFCNTTRAGYYSPNKTLEIACAAGTYNSLTGQTSISACTTCGNGTYCLDTGCSECTQAPGGYIVVPGSEDEEPTACTGAGMFTDYGQTVCRCSDAGYYARVDHTSQAPCPDGYEQPRTCTIVCEEKPSSSKAGLVVGCVIGGIAGVIALAFLVAYLSSINTASTAGPYDRRYSYQPMQTTGV